MRQIPSNHARSLWRQAPDWLVILAYGLLHPWMHWQMGGSCRLPELCQEHSFRLVIRSRGEHHQRLY